MKCTFCNKKIKYISTSNTYWYTCNICNIGLEFETDNMVSWTCMRMINNNIYQIYINVLSNVANVYYHIDNKMILSLENINGNSLNPKLY